VNKYLKFAYIWLVGVNAGHFHTAYERINVTIVLSFPICDAELFRVCFCTYPGTHCQWGEMTHVRHVSLWAYIISADLKSVWYIKSAWVVVIKSALVVFLHVFTCSYLYCHYMFLIWRF